MLCQALRFAHVGVAFKMQLTFVGPTKSRGQWFTQIPPSAVVALPRAKYRGTPCHSPEAWLVLVPRLYWKLCLSVFLFHCLDSNILAFDTKGNKQPLMFASCSIEG